MAPAPKWTPRPRTEVSDEVLEQGQDLPRTGNPVEEVPGQGVVQVKKGMCHEPNGSKKGIFGP